MSFIFGAQRKGARLSAEMAADANTYMTHDGAAGAMTGTHSLP